MLVTLFGIVTLVRLRQQEKAESSMLFMPFGTTRSVTSSPLRYKLPPSGLES